MNSEQPTPPEQSSGTPRIKAVVFDLDGLMINTEDLFERSGRELLNRRGRMMTDDLRRQMMGRRPHEALALLIDAHELSESIEELLAESKALLDRLVQQYLAPMPGLFELLDHVEQCGLRMGVATSSPRSYLEEMLARFDLKRRFAMTLAAEDVTHGKPHPEIYLKAAETLGISPREMLVLEDSEAGTLAGASAQAVIVAVPHDHSRRHDFSSATYVAHSLADPEIVKLLG